VGALGPPVLSATSTFPALFIHRFPLLGLAHRLLSCGALSSVAASFASLTAESAPPEILLAETAIQNRAYFPPPLRFLRYLFIVSIVGFGIPLAQL
jgi:hypothetical protein